MPTSTPNIGLIKSDVGGSIDSWGDNLNANEDVVDVLFDGAQGTGHSHDGTTGEGPKLDPVALEGVAGGAGLVVALAAAFVERVIAGDTGVTVADGDGQAGNPTARLAFDNLSAEADVAENDIVARYDQSLAAMRRSTVAELLRFASVGEIDAGSEAAKTISPATLRQSKTATRAIPMYCVDGDSEVVAGDGAFWWRVPPVLDGHQINYVNASVVTGGSGGPLLTVQIHNFSSGFDILSTPLTIDVNETDSDNATTPAVIDPAQDILLKGQWIRVDVDAVSTLVQKGLYVTMETQLP